jgi:hypothetical protein|tara:strand:- start:45 stop:584 length:540 start_codon:yes stop_codon:yes gene_type:complete
MDFRIAQCVLGAQEPTKMEQPFVDLLKQHLSLDNNKLREDFVCSLLGYTPSYGGQGYPDGYKPDGTCVDNKSGPSVVFPDGAPTLPKKIDWDILVHQFTDNGELIYVAEVKVIDIIDELMESALYYTKKGGRISPQVSYGVWLNKPNTKVLYKNPELFERNKNGRLKKFYDLLNQLPVN